MTVQFSANVNQYWTSAINPVDFAVQPRIKHMTVDIGACEYAGALGTMLLLR